MVLCVDVDCVLNNLTEEWIKALNRAHHMNVKYSDIKQWEIKDLYPMLTEEELYKPLNEKEFIDGLTPFPDSQKYLKKIMDSGSDVYLSTATHYRNIEWKVEWLKKHFPFINPKQVIMIHNKQLLSCNIMVDDYERNLIGGHYTGILMNHPWNADFNERETWKMTNKAYLARIYRAYNWADVYKHWYNMHYKYKMINDAWRDSKKTWVVNQM